MHFSPLVFPILSHASAVNKHFGALLLLMALLVVFLRTLQPADEGLCPLKRSTSTEGDKRLRPNPINSVHTQRRRTISVCGSSSTLDMMAAVGTPFVALFVVFLGGFFFELNFRSIPFAPNFQLESCCDSYERKTFCQHPLRGCNARKQLFE